MIAVKQAAFSKAGFRRHQTTCRPDEFWTAVTPFFGLTHPTSHPTVKLWFRVWSGIICSDWAVVNSPMIKLSQLTLCHYVYRSFSLTAARVWNSLPTTVQSSESLDIYRRRLKTEQFERSYNWHHACQTTLRLCDSLSLSRSFLLWLQPWSL